MSQSPPNLGDLGDLSPPVEALPRATLTPDPPPIDRETLPVLDITAVDVAETTFDELGENMKRQIGAHARALSADPTFLVACNSLTREYVKRFLQLDPSKPGYEARCVRAQIACNIIGDVVAQIGLMAEHNKVPNENVDQTMRGTR